MSDDPLDPNEIPRAEFEIARRGYDQNAVRGYLHRVARLAAAQQREIRELLERAERAETRADLAEHPDEGRMLTMLGEETTRVLTSAKEAAAEIRSKAEEAAERLISEAQGEAAAARAALDAELDERRSAIEADAEQVLDRALTELDRRTTEAEAAAARIIAEAEERANALREEARSELERARAEAEDAVEAARAEGKEMVAEAQALRERVLRDLAARRRKARQQVERLNAGRERLLQAYEVVRRTLDEANAELLVSVGEARVAGEAAARRVAEEAETTLEQLEADLAAGRMMDLAGLDPHDDDPVHEPAEALARSDATEAAPETAGDGQPEVPDGDADTDLEEDAGGVEAEAEAEAAATEVPAEPEEVVPPIADEAGVPAEPEASDVTTVAEEAHEQAEVEAGVPAEPEASDRTEADEAGERIAVEPDAPADAETSVEDAAVEDEAPVEDLDRVVSDVAPAPDEAAEGGTVDDLFARLRAASGSGEATPREPVAEEASAPVAAVVVADEPDPGAAPDADAEALVARDEALEPLERELTRRLKRVLADEQNEVLDRLRTARPTDAETLLPAVPEHAGRWASAAAEHLDAAATAGAAAAGVPGGATAPQAFAYDLAHALIAPLRERVGRAFVAADGDPDEVSERLRALYREWKGQRLVDGARHALVAAYVSGLYGALPDGCPLRWVVDRAGEPCPDADDNALAGAVRRGEPFPTGDAMPPAHPGCRCLVLPADK